MRRSTEASRCAAREADSALRAPGSWGTVRVEAATTIRAPAERVVARYLDFAHWPQLFPATIRGTRLLRREGNTTVVEVDHRTAGPVLNVIRPTSARTIELEEHKPTYDATFLNRFEPTADGTRFTVVARIRLRWPYALLAPFVKGYVRRSVRRYVLEPMRDAAERDPGAVRGG
jgi:hypothetical protein